MLKHFTLSCLVRLILINCCWSIPTITAAQSVTGIPINGSQQSFIDKPVSNHRLFKPGLYWNPQRKGWGINITQVSQNDGSVHLVAVLYTYRIDGSPVWYLASGPIESNSWKAPLHEFFWNGTTAKATDIGSIELDFKSFDSATMDYRIDGVSGTEAVEFYKFDLPPTNVELTGLWYPPSETGRGLTVSTIGDTSVAVVYFYDESGRPTWLIGSQAQTVRFDSETRIPVALMSGYCLTCSTINATAKPAGTLNLTYHSRSNAQLVTDNISSWQTDIDIIQLSDLIDTNDCDTPNPDIDLEEDNETCYDPELIQLQGVILDQTGRALAGANVSVAGMSVSTNSLGGFVLKHLARKNVVLTASAFGHRTEFIPIYLNHPAQVGSVKLEPIILPARKIDTVRMLFGGDVAFGRRFLDPDESTAIDEVPPDDPNALIQASQPDVGTRAVIKEIRPWYQESDFGVLNFETPVTNTPITPHQEKDFVFFTLPESVLSLKWLGVDYVSLGNNHVYDYLEKGVIDTLENLKLYNLAHSGAGLNSAQAFRPYRINLAGSNYGFLSMTSADGSRFTQSYVADQNKGGAADLNSESEVVAAIRNEQQAGYIPILQYHTGKEYIFEPTEFVLNKLQLAANNNAPLLIAHHPHVAQGVGVFNNMVAVLGLGNLAFDQTRLETLLGLVARVDMRGNKVDQLRLLPVYLENYAPQVISGDLASNFLRRIGEFSHAYGALVYPYNGQGWVDLGEGNTRRLEHSVDIDITIPESGNTIVDLRTWAQQNESLLSLRTTSILDFQMGRDLFGYGDFEDWDTDNQQTEAARWYLEGASHYLCNDNVYRGKTALCSTRKSSNRSDSVTPNRNRIRVMGDALDTPNKDLSLFGYLKTENTGKIIIQTRYYASFGDMVFGQEDAVTHPGHPGINLDWHAFSADLNMPAEVPVETGQVANALNARALRIFIRQSPPEEGYALARFDDIAVISWENSIASGFELQIPHAKDFLRVKGSPGTYQVQLTFGRHTPAQIH